MSPKTPTEAEIAKKAYDLWEAEGRPEGRDIAHWHQAAQNVAEPVIAPIAEPTSAAVVEEVSAEEAPAPKPRATRARKPKAVTEAGEDAAPKAKAPRRRKATPEA